MVPKDLRLYLRLEQLPKTGQILQNFNLTNFSATQGKVHYGAFEIGVPISLLCQFDEQR